MQKLGFMTDDEKLEEKNQEAIRYMIATKRESCVAMSADVKEDNPVDSDK
jgi:hypothetical protein